jgi:hypothetical protein
MRNRPCFASVRNASASADVPPGNGRYIIGAEPTFPTQSLEESCYWVDVLFDDANIPDPPPEPPAAENVINDKARFRYWMDLAAGASEDYV